MKVFISWSGTSSQQIAEVLRQWIPKVMQSADAFLSSEDIEKGDFWASALAKSLDESSFGIVCITPENKSAPWLHFEAGAIRRSVGKGNVSPLLFGVKTSALPAPLAQFQCTRCTKSDLKKLFSSINQRSSNPLVDDQWEFSFESAWPKMNEELKEAAKADSSSPQPEKERTAEELLDRVLALLMVQNRRLADLRPHDSVPIDLPVSRGDLLRARHAANSFIDECEKFDVVPSAGALEMAHEVRRLSNLVLDALRENRIRRLRKHGRRRDLFDDDW